MLGCLASGRTNVRCVCLLQGGAVSILSPPVPPTQSPAPVQQLRLADPVEAIACSTDGAFLAVASRTELRVYAVAEGAPGSDGPRAHLRWRAPLHAHVRGLAISGSAALPSVVVAVGGAPGLRLLVGGGGNGSGIGERGGEDSAVGHGEGGSGATATLAHRASVLHAGRAVCRCLSTPLRCLAPSWLDEPPTACPKPSPAPSPSRTSNQVCGCALSDDGALLALALLDGALYPSPNPSPNPNA